MIFFQAGLLLRSPFCDATKKLYSDPTFAGANIYQWEDDVDEINITWKPDNTVIIAARRIPQTLNARKYGPQKCSLLQGLSLKMSLYELKESFFAPLKKVADDMYLAHAIFKGEPTIITFSFEDDKLILISLQLSQDKLKYEEYKKFLINIYGLPTMENASALACLWQDNDQNTILVWIEESNRFYLMYKIGF